jgi:hypothetical protein
MSAALVKTLLPIRAERSVLRGHPQIVLHYEGRGPGGARQQYQHWVGPPLDDNSMAYHRDPFGVAVLQVMQLFWELETSIEKMVRERDEASQRAAALLSENADLTRRCHGLEAKLKQVNGKKG